MPAMASRARPVGQQPAGAGAARIDEVERDARAAAGHAGQLEVAGRRGLAVGDRHVGDDQLLGVRVVDAHQRLAVARGHQPSSMANGPTDDEQLPQLPA